MSGPDESTPVGPPFLPESNADHLGFDVIFDDFGNSAFDAAGLQTGQSDDSISVNGYSSHLSSNSAGLMPRVGVPSAHFALMGPNDSDQLQSALAWDTTHFPMDLPLSQTVNGSWVHTHLPMEIYPSVNDEPAPSQAV
jgi:hypothetical protein